MMFQALKDSRATAAAARTSRLESAPQKSLLDRFAAKPVPDIPSTLAAPKRKRDTIQQAVSKRAKRTKTATAPKRPKSFLDLPPELRNEIYEYLDPRLDSIEISVGKTTPRYSTNIPRGSSGGSLMRTCKTLYCETVPMFFQTTKFTISGIMWADALPIFAAPLVKHIRIRFFNLARVPKNSWPQLAKSTGLETVTMVVSPNEHSSAQNAVDILMPFAENWLNPSKKLEAKEQAAPKHDFDVLKRSALADPTIKPWVVLKFEASADSTAQRRQEVEKYGREIKAEMRKRLTKSTAAQPAVVAPVQARREDDVRRLRQDHFNRASDGWQGTMRISRDTKKPAPVLRRSNAPTYSNTPPKGVVNAGSCNDYSGFMGGAKKKKRN